MLLQAACSSFFLEPNDMKPGRIPKHMLDNCVLDACASFFFVVVGEGGRSSELYDKFDGYFYIRIFKSLEFILVL